MRNNQPVTDNEVLLDEATLIVSKTDKKGVITYVNRDFVEVSGFSEDELLGQPHNIVRHPDMPAEAFEDMWRDLESGRPWTGLVKNRCKNGDFYWVLATATPMYEHGQVVGYMSVRRKAGHDAIDAAGQAYQLFRDKVAGNLQIRHGQVVQGGAGLFSGWSLRSKMLSGFAILLLAMVCLAGVGLAGLSASNEAVGKLYSDRLKPTQALAVIGRLTSDTRAQIMLSLQHDPAGPNAALHDHALEQHLTALDHSLQEIEREWEGYRGSLVSDEERRLAQSFDEVRGRYVGEGLLPARKALVEGRFGDANLLLLKTINPAYANVAQKVDELYAAQVSGGQRQMQESAEKFAAVRAWTAGILLLALIAGVLVSHLIIRSITRPVATIIETFRRLVHGDFTHNVDVSRDDEIGKVLQGLQSMQIQQGFQVAESVRLANDNLRIRVALDCVSANLRVADDAGKVIYANRGLLRTLEGLEKKIAHEKPGFAAEGFVGSNLDESLGEEAESVQALHEMRATRQREMRLGGRLFDVVANPILNERGQRLGTVAEWIDRTAERQAQQALAELVGKASAGDLQARLDTDAMEGFYRQIGEGINSLLATSNNAINEIAGLLERVAAGDLTHTIRGDFRGKFARLRDDANQTVERLRELVGGIQHSASLINTAAKEIAAGNQDLSSRTEEQASSLEETASSMEELTGTVRMNAENARQASEFAGGAQAVAQRGGEMVRQVVSTMEAINQSSNRIADIIGVIDGIAFQTNILALNAAVEAARAGEQGRGFAVVATEVRSLAQRSAAAAKEIKGLISDSVEKVAIGSKQVDQAGSTMEDIVASIRRVAGIMAGISDASREQSAGIEQVSRAVVQMDEVTQQNAALVEEAAAAAESLEGQAQTLARAVSVFRVGTERRYASGAQEGKILRSTREKIEKKPGSAKVLLPASLDDEWEEF
jgi:methyl-accepting chemotaxis protein